MTTTADSDLTEMMFIVYVFILFIYFHLCDCERVSLLRITHTDLKKHR